MIQDDFKKELNRTSNFMLTRIFKHPTNPIKIKPVKYKNEVQIAYAYALCFLSEKLVNNYRDNEYENIEVLIGDLELIGVEMLNQIKKLANPASIEKFKLDDFLQKK